MTYTQPSTTPAAWDAAVSRYETTSKAYHASEVDPATTDEAGEALHDAMSDAWEAMIDTRAPDAAASAYKLRDLIREVYAAEIGDDVDDMDLLQRLIDSRTVDGPFPLVRLYQDALYQAGIEHPAAGLVRSRDKPWPVFAAQYRRTVTRLKADFSATTHDDMLDTLNERHRPLYNDLLAYPVANAVELAEKIELLSLDCWDEGPAFKVIAADAARVAGSAA